MNAEPVAHTPGPWRYFDPSGERKPDPDHGTYFEIAGGAGFSFGGRGFGVTGFVPEADHVPATPPVNVHTSALPGVTGVYRVRAGRP